MRTGYMWASPFQTLSGEMRDVELRLDGPVRAMLHEDSEIGQATVSVVGLTAEAGVPVTLTMRSAGTTEEGHELFILEFSGDTGNEAIRGNVMLRFVQGHC